MKILSLLSHLLIIFLLGFFCLSSFFSVVSAQVICPTNLEINLPSCPPGCKPFFISTLNRYICQVIQVNDKGSITNPALDPSVGSGDAGETILARLLAAIINLFFIAGSVAVLVYLLMGGLAYITSEGDKNKAEIAKNRITNAVFGLVIIVAVYAVLRLLGQFLQINFFEDLIIKWPTIVE